MKKHNGVDSTKTTRLAIRINKQKYILKTENKRKIWSEINLHNDWFGSFRICQRIFKYSYYDTEKERYSMPKLFLRNHCGVLRLDIGCQVLNAYLKRQEKELEEVKAFYEQRKAELATTLRAHRKEHANEIIECPICLAKVTRTGISKHKKTIKCQSVLQETTHHPTSLSPKYPRNHA